MRDLREKQLFRAADKLVATASPKKGPRRHNHHYETIPVKPLHRRQTFANHKKQKYPISKSLDDGVAKEEKGKCTKKLRPSGGASISSPTTPVSHRRVAARPPWANICDFEASIIEYKPKTSKNTPIAIRKIPPKQLLSLDSSPILDVYDPSKSLKAHKKDVNDECRAIQIELKEYGIVSSVLRLGRFRRSKLGDLPGIQQVHSNILVRKYRFLQRPKKKPLHEYYNDDDAELEALAKVVDPNAPRPQGALIIPARGEHPSNTQPSTLPRSIDSALHRYGTTLPKATVGVVLDHAGKPSTSLTYGKLLSRANKVAYMLLNKTISTGTGKDAIKAPICKPGDRVALVYPNTEPLTFITAFYGCLLAGVVPVPVEVPLTKRDAGIQQLGFLLGSCGVRVALTSEQCFKGLPKASEANGSTSSSSSHHHNDVVDFKGWPKLHWAITEHLNKPPKDWNVPPRLADDSVAYIEYTTDKEGAVKGVSVSRQAMLSHCRAIAQAMNYKEGETMVCVLDFKREVGLWHAILTSVFKGMRVIFVPYSLMKISPTSWMMMVTKLQAQTALLKSRDLHWSLLASKEHTNVNLSSLNSIIVADGANPWSLSSCDQFQQTFRLKPSVLCPCAGSSETGTVAIRRPSEKSSGRGVLSMSALSHSVVIVEQENALTSLTLQDAGQVIPGGVAVVVKLSGPPRLCKTDEVGEICIHANSTGSGYWGLDGVSANTFKVEPLGIDDKPLGPVQYVRSGLIGFLGPEGLIFVIGNKSSLMNVSGRQHSADDLIATVLAVEPMRFIYRGRMAVFSTKVLRDERICIIAEQKPDVAEEDAFNWMSRVLQAIDTIHQVGIYCLALVQPNQLPKTPLGGIHVSETRQRFLDGTLHPTTLLMCPHSCVINLPKPREQQSDVGPAAMFVGNIVQGVRIADAKGRELPFTEEEKNTHLVDVLKQRAVQSPDHILYTMMNAKGMEVESVTCAALLKKAERIAALLLDKGHLSQGDHVALIFPPGIDLIAAFYGCQAAGLVPVCIRPPHAQTLQSTLPTVRMVVDVSKAVALLSTSAMIKLLKCKEAAHRVDIKAWPLILDVEDVPSSSAARRRHALDQVERSPSDPCYLDFSVSTTGQLAGIVVSSQGAVTMCKSLKMACELYPSRHVTLCLDPYCGLGFALWCLSSVYSGHHTILIPPADVEANPSLWLQTVSQQKVRDTFCSYGVMDLCVRELATQVDQLKEKGINLSCLRTCVVVAEERPRVSLCTTFSKLFAPLGLSVRAVSTSFGCRVNTAICMQGASSPDPATVYVDARALRNDRVTLVEKGAPHSVALMESGKLLPGVKVVIANPETKGQCADSHLGEIWVSSGHNAEGYFSIFGEEAHLHTDHFNARLKTGDTKTKFARTGYLGFLRQTQAITADGELHDAVFVVGALDETMMLRGMRYHPVDIEVTVIRAHRKIMECAVFTWTHLLVVVAETEGSEAEALDLVPAITSAVLEEHHLIVGVVVIVDPGIVPINSRGEKQRMHLRDAFLKDQLDPIYVAYNM
ncbi:hypothetical protein QR680_009967 [Steinernema hermaphroditum]|uniref:DMAP1-binding domain-containing protein n=1 Tax=Steinernema hermaphroditum TaxID=289476 RepID=A0AA39MAV2_9BILA|nr:hypothetical protein QR680_009967 [Steinernema hermaphroditum]